MNTYSIIFAQSAEKELLRLPRSVSDKIFQKVELLANNPRPSGCKKIVGSLNSFRIRVGDYRVVYSVFDDTLTIDIIKIGHRKDVYEW